MFAANLGVALAATEYGQDYLQLELRRKDSSLIQRVSLGPIGAISVLTSFEVLIHTAYMERTCISNTIQ